MPVTKRRQAQMQTTRQAILDSAREIARTEGWSAVTIRRVAEMIDYSAPVIYEYFAGKEALFEAVQREGFDLLYERMRSTADTPGRQPEEALFSIIDDYMRFAREFPELYQIMHGISSASVPLTSTVESAARLCDLGEQALRRWASAAGASIGDMSDAVETCWALLHGIVSVDLLGRLGDDPARARRLARVAVADLLRAWS